MSITVRTNELPEKKKIPFKKLTKNKWFITDLGFGKRVAKTKDDTSELMRCFEVWSPNKNKTGHKIVEIGYNLSKLQEKYRVNDELVFIASHNE